MQFCDNENNKRESEGAAATAPGDEVLPPGRTHFLDLHPLRLLFQDVYPPRLLFRISILLVFFSRIFILLVFFSRIFTLLVFLSRMFILLVFFFRISILLVVFSRMIPRSYLQPHLVACGLVDHVDRRSNPPVKPGMAVHHPPYLLVPGPGSTHTLAAPHPVTPTIHTSLPGPPNGESFKGQMVCLSGFL